MWRAADLAAWTGRTDPGGTTADRRWHQAIGEPDASRSGLCLLGLCSDEGVARNQGRTGAAAGPEALRRALGGLALHADLPLYDGGDVVAGDALEAAQDLYAEHVAAQLEAGHFVLGLGGGHEIAWGTYQGLARWLEGTETGLGARVGIINFDAHFDLRDPVAGATSGTPFRQIAAARTAAGSSFAYLCLGISEASNTRSLFDTAEALKVDYLLDVACTTQAAFPAIRAFIGGLDTLYVSVCLDALPAGLAPGVSAPAAPGIGMDFMIACLRFIGERVATGDCRWPVADIAELNPRFDVDGRTARAAARLAWEIARSAARGAAPRPGGQVRPTAG